MDIATRYYNTIRFIVILSGIALTIMLSGCPVTPTPPTDSETELIAKGKNIFFNETFNGNGRTCGTCHPEENNFTIDPAFIATLPDNNALFVAEFNPNLKENFESPKLMREFGLILENLDGFDDLENDFVLRGVPHILAQRTSIDSPQGPRTGWSGDGAPGDGSLRSFAIGAVIQHFTKRLARVAGVDFRLPTDEELDALEAFQLSLGRQQEAVLPLPLKNVLTKRGQKIFLDDSLGKCNLCHVNAGATADFGNGNIGNANFNTGVEDLIDLPHDLTDEQVPTDDGFDTPGDGTFNTPPVIESADTGPFFHNNAVATIEGAVEFYNSDAFNNSPAGRVLAALDPDGVAIKLEATQTAAVAAFLRAINALENIRQSIMLLEMGTRKTWFEHEHAETLIEHATHETEDGIEVLTGAGLHAEAVAHLKKARRLQRKAARSSFSWHGYAEEAIREQKLARDEIVNP